MARCAHEAERRNGLVSGQGPTIPPYRVIAPRGRPHHRAERHEPHKGGSGRVRRNDVRVIATVDHHSSVTLLDDWRTIASPHGVDVDWPNDEGRTESDPSAMLGLVLVLVANTAVVAALVAVVVWILA